MAKETLIINFPPGKFFYYPPNPNAGAWGKHSYLYLEGKMRFVEGEGIFPENSKAFAIQVFPLVISGAPRGAVQVTNVPNFHIQPVAYFGGQFSIQIPGNRGLVFRAAGGIKIDAFLGNKGEKAYQLLPIRFDHITLRYQ